MPFSPQLTSGIQVLSQLDPNKKCVSLNANTSSLKIVEKRSRASNLICWFVHLITCTLISRNRNLDKVCLHILQNATGLKNDITEQEKKSLINALNNLCVIIKKNGGSKGQKVTALLATVDKISCLKENAPAKVPPKEEKKAEVKNDSQQKPPKEKTPVEKEPSVETELDKEKKAVVELFTPQMVDALGGVDQVLSFPKIEGFTGQITRKDLKAPVMRGDDGSLLFCYLKSSKIEVTGEYLRRNKDGTWEGTYAYPSELNLRVANLTIKDGSLEEKYMLDKINRLMHYKPVGRLEIYLENIIMKPADKDSFRPTQAYLSGEELTAYMDFETLFYERALNEGTTDLFLWDPSKSTEENKKIYKEKFPDV
ncbi:MAG: hypothetical protein CK425_08440 [Parachlamydia sp.]|nr:MAG: hypothetical protein CK425_08440 [Parachlamydia sp.]